MKRGVSRWAMLEQHIPRREREFLSAFRRLFDLSRREPREKRRIVRMQEAGDGGGGGVLAHGRKGVLLGTVGCRETHRSPIEERIRAFWEEAFNGRDLDLIEAITAPEFVNHNALPGTPPGPEGQRQVVERLLEAFPDAHFEIKHLASDGDTVICIGTMSGTHEGTLLGVPATGRKVEWRQCHLYRFDENGRAIEHDAIRDDVGLLRQFKPTP